MKLAEMYEIELEDVKCVKLIVLSEYFSLFIYFLFFYAIFIAEPLIIRKLKRIMDNLIFNNVKLLFLTTSLIRFNNVSTTK